MNQGPATTSTFALNPWRFKVHVKDRSAVGAATSTAQTFDELILRCLEEDHLVHFTGNF
jgi:hypothetical protein